MTTGFETFIGFLALTCTVMFGWGQYKNGKSVAAQREAQQASDTVALLKTRADEFEKQLKQAQDQLSTNHDQIIRLEEQLKHKDDQIAQYMGIIQNRNPDLEKTLLEVRNFLESLNRKIGVGDAVVVK